MPQGYTSLAAGLLLSQILWSVLGIAALVLAIVSIRRGSHRSRGIIALIAAIVAPIASFTPFTGLVLATAPLG